jgi:hypothetical protein
VTAEGTILGTLQYMAPEQLEGREADARTDIWALGAILYEMVTGRRAFEGESQVSLIGNIMNAEPALLATVQPLTPPALDRVVTKCLAKHPDGRWDSARDVADELRWIAQVGSATGPAQAHSRRGPGISATVAAAGVVVGVLVGAALMMVVRPAAPVTARGTILGTLQYMAPEQLEGKEADARTDLWALGAILYEMLTGKRAFAGDSDVSLIGNIMNAEPAALSSLQPLTPPSLDRVVKKCLAKHPDDRWDTAHDVADELRWIAQASAASSATAMAPGRRTSRRWLTALVALAVLAAALAGFGAGWFMRPAPKASPPVRVTVPIAPATELMTIMLGRTAFAWTPDGQALVFAGARDNRLHLYVRPIDAPEARELPNTDDARVLAISPDGRWVAFWAAPPGANWLSSSGRRATLPWPPSRTGAPHSGC